MQEWHNAAVLEVKAPQTHEFKEIGSLRKTQLTSTWQPEWVPGWVAAVHKAAVIEELSVLNTSATAVLLPSPTTSHKEIKVNYERTKQEGEHCLKKETKPQYTKGKAVIS